MLPLNCLFRTHFVSNGFCCSPVIVLMFSNTLVFDFHEPHFSFPSFLICRQRVLPLCLTHISKLLQKHKNKQQPFDSTAIRYLLRSLIIGTRPRSHISFIVAFWEYHTSWCTLRLIRPFHSLWIRHMWSGVARVLSFQFKLILMNEIVISSFGWVIVVAILIKYSESLASGWSVWFIRVLIAAGFSERATMIHMWVY